MGGKLDWVAPFTSPAGVDNYDVRWEVFPGLGELIAISLFNRRFHDPIEQIIEPTAQLRVSFQNARSTLSSGTTLRRRSETPWPRN